VKISWPATVEKKHEIALVLLVLFKIFTAYSYGVADHFIKIPFIQSAIDSSLYPKDMAVSMGDYYVSYLYAFILPLEKIVGMETACFVVYVFSAFLFYLSIYLIGSRFFSNKTVGLIAVMLLLTAKPTLAGLGVVTFDDYLAARSVGFSIVMFSLYVFVAERRLLGGLLLGLAANIHVIIAVNAGLVIFVVLAGELISDGRGRKFFRNVILFGGAAFIGMLPLFIRQVTLFGVTGMLTVVDPEWLNVIFQSSRTYVIADTLNVSLLQMYGLAVLLSCLSAVIMPNLSLSPQARRWLLSTVVAALVGFFLFVCFSRVWPLLLGMDLCFHRTSKIFLVFLYIFLAYLLHGHFNTCRPVLLIWVMVFVKFTSALSFVYALFIFAIVNLLKETLKNYFDFSGGAVVDLSRAINRRMGLNVMVALFLVFMTACINRPPRFNNPLIQDRSPSIEVQHWLRNNTPVDALILSPPTDFLFRIYSQRSIVRGARDSTYANINRDYAMEMWERGADLMGFNRRIKNFPPLIDFGVREGKSFRKEIKEKIKNYYAGMEPDRIQELIEKYEVDYLVMNIENRLPFPLLYKNELYAVYGPFCRRVLQN